MQLQAVTKGGGEIRRFQERRKTVDAQFNYVATPTVAMS
jgi:hypothetical protein